MAGWFWYAVGATVLNGLHQVFTKLSAAAGSGLPRVRPRVDGDMNTVGLIADTHGLVRPEALAALAGVERIVHAGDIGGAEVLDALAQVAPVDAVRGNVDFGPWASALPMQRVIEIGSVRLLVLHDLGQLELIRGRRVWRIAGHSHQPLKLVSEGCAVAESRQCGAAALPPAGHDHAPGDRRHHAAARADRTDSVAVGRTPPKEMNMVLRLVISVAVFVIALLLGRVAASLVERRWGSFGPLLGAAIGGLGAVGAASVSGVLRCLQERQSSSGRFSGTSSRGAASRAGGTPPSASPRSVSTVPSPRR